MKGLAMSTVTINFNHGGADLILEVEYDFEPGEKETPPSYASGGEPAVGPSISINSLRLADVDETAAALTAAGISATEPKRYPEYAPDYAATFFTDPDGIRLEVTNYRQERRDRHDR